MDDITTYALLTASFFFVALALALLARYRQVSQKINTSTDLGHDLWSSLEQRLKKQDERILDVMGRLEVVQARIMATAVNQTPAALRPLPQIAIPATKSEAEPNIVTEYAPIAQQSKSQESQVLRPPIQPPIAETELDKTERLALSLLGAGPLATPDILKGLVRNGGPKSREHASRLMKVLFDKGLVRRNDSTKPFVYELTGEGKRRLT